MVQTSQVQICLVTPLICWPNHSGHLALRLFCWPRGSGSGHKEMGRQQRYFWSYTGLESSLSCFIQPWWGRPELNLSLCKSQSCTHTELIWVMERSMERWNWWRCLCESASGRKEVLPLLETASFYIVSVTAECWSCCCDLGDCAQPHPERAPCGGHGRAQEKGQELLKCNSLSDTHFVLVLDCFCVFTVLGLVSKLTQKPRGCTREKGDVLAELLVRNWSLGLGRFWIQVCCPKPASWGSSSAMSRLTWVSFDPVLEPPSATINPCPVLHWVYSQH